MKKSSTFHVNFSNIGKGLNGLFVKLFGSASEKIAMDIIANCEIDATCEIELTPEEYKEFMEIDENIIDHEFEHLQDRTKKFISACGVAAHDILDIVAAETKHFAKLDDERSERREARWEKKRKEEEKKAKSEKKD